MPFDKDTYNIFESYSKPATPNKKDHNKPSSLKDVKDLSGGPDSGTELDVKGQLTDKGNAGNTPVDVTGAKQKDKKKVNEVTEGQHGLTDDEIMQVVVKIERMFPALHPADWYNVTEHLRRRANEDEPNVGKAPFSDREDFGADM